MRHLRSPLLDWTLIICVVVGNAVAWAIPSNVAKLIAREQDVLFGRYSRAQFCWLLFALIVSLILVFLHFTPTPQVKRRRAFGVLAFFIGLIPAILVVEAALRLRTEYPYATDPYVYHRPPRAVYHLPYEDVPPTRRSYPTTPAGYGRVDCVMTFDSQGFRNSTDMATYDIVAVGDSFTEGSRVSDDQPWPVQLARMSGLSICNLGISGYGPPEYLAAMEHYGLNKKPKFVICMFYEGNDFRSSKMTAKAGLTLTQIVASSPLVVRINDFLCERLGEIGSKSPVKHAEALSWLPVRILNNDSGRNYGFPSKQLTDLSSPKDKLELEGSWYVTTEVLKKVNAACEAAGAKLIVAYAPSKAHVVFPLVARSVNPEYVRKYMLYKKSPLDLPEGDKFIPELLARMPSQELLMREWCERRSVGFISLTEPLREDVAKGRQTYYTYDQHWTPLGHETAARTVHSYLSQALKVVSGK